MKLIIKKATPIAVMTGLFSLAACGSTEQSNQIQANSTTSQTAVNQVNTVDPIDLNLTTAPIDKQSFLGLIATETKPTAPCPFLSDETARATVKNDWDLKRRETSNQQCLWSKNAGFSIKVSAEPLATAKPVKERIYNVDSPPVLKEQAAPGNHAVILYDTTWDKEQAYAMSFEQDNQLVVIYVTGMSTNAERLTTTAKEVAAKLTTMTNTAPQVAISNNFDLCNTWSKSAIATIVGTPITVTPGSLDCKWENGVGADLKQVRVTIYSGKSYPWEDVLKYRGSQKITGIGERGLMEKKRQRKNMPAHVLLNTLYNDKLVTITTTDTIEDHEALALALSKNIDQRFE